jgi:MFS family permease
MVLGAAFGALAAVLVNDRLGRLRAWQLSIVIYIVGLFIQIFSSGIYGLLLFARIFSGLGAGALTVIAPLYLSEIAPARTRGLIVSVYMVLLLTILTLGVYPDAKRER